MKASYTVIPCERTVRMETEDLDPASLAAGEILIQGECSILSPGTELANYTGLSPGVRIPGSWNAYPWRPGYGMVGRVLAVGPETRNLAVGERVLCFGKHASLQRQDVSARVPTAAAFSIGDRVPAAHALLARMGLIGLAARQLSEVQAPCTVAMFGLGLVGLLAAQLYRMAGAKVIGLEPVHGRAQLGRAIGIDTVLEVPPRDQVQALRDATQGRGVQIAVDAVGHARVVEACIQACAAHGQVILMGSPRAPFEADLTASLRLVHHRWLAIRGALEWRLPPYADGEDGPTIASNLTLLLEAAASGQLALDPLVTDVVRPEGLEEAYRGLLDHPGQHVGVLVDWTAAR